MASITPTRKPYSHPRKLAERPAETMFGGTEEFAKVRNKILQFPLVFHAISNKALKLFQYAICKLAGMSSLSPNVSPSCAV